MGRVEYKGYIIHATPYQLAKDKSWTINIHIKENPVSDQAKCLLIRKKTSLIGRFYLP